MMLRFLEKVHQVDNVWTFRFEPNESMSWEAGQFIQVELPHQNPDNEGTKRWFTVSSAPYERVVEITTRVTNSSFKQALNGFKKGDDLKLIDMPDGDFVWQDSDKPLFFVAGGIGITPFYSILKQRSHDKLPLNAIVAYGNRTDDIPFKDELNQLATNDQNLKIHYIIGSPTTADSLTNLNSNINLSVVYVSGPESMVEELGAQLKKNGLADTQLKQDFFPNYSMLNY